MNAYSFEKTTSVFPLAKNFSMSWVCGSIENVQDVVEGGKHVVVVTHGVNPPVF